MARSSASHELFKDGVRAALYGWPVLQVSYRCTWWTGVEERAAEMRPTTWPVRFRRLDAKRLKLAVRTKGNLLFTVVLSRDPRHQGPEAVALKVTASSKVNVTSY